MKNAKQIIMYVCLFALALQSTPIAHAAAFKERMRSAAGSIGTLFSGALRSTSELAQKKLGEASSHIKNMDRAALFASVSNKLESAGVRVRRISNCIATGQECNPSDRVMLIGTASFIFVALLVLAGSALTVAARADLVEKAKREETQKTKGSPPSTLIARLGNTLQSGKARFKSLKSGIISGKLTKSERNFLIGFGVSIIGATLVTAAVLAGLALYSKKQEQSRVPEKDLQPAAQAIETVSPTTTIPLAQLAQATIIGGIESTQGSFGKLFDTVIKMREAGSNILQRSAKIVKKDLEKTRRLAQQALQATGEEKDRLIQQANDAYKRALAQANTVIATVKSEGSSLIKQALYDLFGIRYDNVKQSIAQFNQELGQLNPKLAALSAVPTWKNITSVQNNWAAVQTKGYALWNSLGALLQQLAGRKKAREGWWGYLGYGTPQEESREKRAELMRDYPLAYKLDFLLEIYPKFLQSVAQTDLISAGNAVEQLLYHTGKTLQNLASLPSSSGVWGQLLISPEMVNSLKNIGTHILQLGVHLKDFTHGEPLKELTHQLPSRLEETPIREWFNAVMWQPAASVQQIKKITNTLTPQMLEANEQLRNALTKATQLSNTFTQHSSNLLLLVKQNMVETLSQKPFQNYLNAAKQAVAKEAKISKELLNDLLLYVAGIINYLEKLISPLIETVETINSILGKELISQSNLDKLKQSAAQFVSIRDELARLRRSAKENLPE